MRRDLISVLIVFALVVVVLGWWELNKEYRFWKAKVAPVVDKTSLLVDNAAGTSTDIKAMIAQMRQLMESLTSRVTMLERQNTEQAQLLEQKDAEFQKAMKTVSELHSQNTAMQTRLKTQAQAQAQAAPKKE